jgi:hypothetical protein
MTRKPNWPDELSAFIEERRHEPFVWGVNDCCLFACDWIKRATGIDPAFALRDKYHSAISAQRLIKKNGGITGIVQNYGVPCGITRIESSKAGRGDIVVCDGGEGECIGISLGSVTAYVGKSGLTFFPMSAEKETTCWRL